MLQLSVWRRLRFPRALMPDLINIEKPNSVADGQGGYVNTWSTIATSVRGLVMDTSPPPTPKGNEYIALGAAGEHVTHRIWIRYDITGLDATCRVLFKGAYFRVHDVGHFGGNVLVQCEEVRQ